MFFPKAMTEIEMIVPSRDLVTVTKILSGHGVFHQADSSYSYPSSASGSDSPNLWQERAAEFAALERRIQTIMQTLGVEEGRPPTTDSDPVIEVEAVRSIVEGIEAEAKKTSDQLVEEKKRLEQFDGNLRQLEPISDVDFDISSLRNSRYLFSMLGLIPAANVDRLQTSLARVPYVFMTLRSDPQKPIVWLTGTQSNADVIERAARSAYLDPLTLPEGYEGTPAQIIKSLNEMAAGTQANISKLNAELGRLADVHGEQLRSLLWKVHESRILADAIVRFGRLRYTYVVVGWVPSDDLEELSQRIKLVSKETLIETLPTNRHGTNRDVPVALEHSKFLRPFQMLVTTYARPRYGELDPTWLIALTFPLLFGAMFGDVGHGLLLAGLGALISSRKVKALRGLAGLGGLITICGLVAAVFGFLYGSLFGYEDILPALWLHPLENILEILMVAIGAGIILLTLGFLIGIFNAWISRDWGRLFFDHNGLAGFVLYWSLLGLLGSALGKLPVSPMVFIILAAVSGLMIMFSEVLKHLVEGHRPLVEGGLGTYAIQAPVELFETVISFLSNSLSYVRVGAFAVAHGGLSAAIFILAGLFGSKYGIGYWVVVVLGNLFIVGFEGLIVGIQTMRLSYYEFFSKFFTGGGMRFEPLRLTPPEEE